MRRTSSHSSAQAKRRVLRDPLREILESEDGADTKDSRIALLRQQGDGRCAADPAVRSAFEELMDAYAKVLHTRFQRGESVSWDDLEEL